MDSHFNVAPRFTPGSPAQVPFTIAARVAIEEREARERSLTGVYGVADQLRAAAPGALRGIVEERIERPGCWIVRDLITDDHFIRPFEVYNETPYRAGARYRRLKERYALPLESEVKDTCR
jgi:hypothetical protein